MEQELCKKRGWITQTEFSGVYSACKLFPGPTAVQMAIFLGWHRNGWKGGITSGLSFILPAFLMVVLLGAIYLQYGLHPTVSHWLLGMQAGALAIIWFSTFQLSRPYLKVPRAILIGILSAILIYYRPNLEPLIIISFGLTGAGLFARSNHQKHLGMFSLISGSLPFLNGQVWQSSQGWVASKFLTLFWICFKSGAFVFGSGLAIIPLLENDFVHQLGWLTHNEFMDALSVGQITPGPVTITATFIGMKVAGIKGALVATVGMFAPAFFNILVILPRVWRKMLNSPSAAGFTAWAFPSVVGGIVGASFKLSLASLNHWIPFLFFLGAVGLLAKWRVPNWIIVPLGGLVAALMT
jgi:chromate transporter